MVRAWVDLSLQTKLLLFALALVTLPGIIFAMLAFAGTRSALEREVGIQLQHSFGRIDLRGPQLDLRTTPAVQRGDENTSEL